MTQEAGENPHTWVRRQGAVTAASVVFVETHPQLINSSGSVSLCSSVCLAVILCLDD